MIPSLQYTDLHNNVRLKLNVPAEVLCNKSNRLWAINSFVPGVYLTEKEVYMPP